MGVFLKGHAGDRLKVDRQTRDEECAGCVGALSPDGCPLIFLDDCRTVP